MIKISNTPLTINGMTLKNRFVMAPMGVNYAAPNGEVTEQLISYYEERAQGGVALVIVETAHIEVAGKNLCGGLGVYSDSHISGLKSLVERVHAQGANIALQLLHRGRNASDQITGLPVKLVSHVPGLCPPHGRVMTEEEIGQLVVKYGEAAQRAQQAGFDAVEIHGAHGYLINQFLSPLTNKRTDRYGASLENRMRFALEVIESVRAKVGKAYPVLFRIGTREGYPGGMTLEDVLPVIRRLADHVDALHVSAGITESSLVIPSAEYPKAWNSEDTRRIRQTVEGKIPVIAVGRYADPSLAERIIREGTADLVALGRPLLADSHYVDKFFHGRAEEIIRCIACNEGCIGRTGVGLEVRCALNPLTSREYLRPFRPASPIRKKVWVAGGGPAGMEAALRAAELGHEVTLMESSSVLGGLLNLACKPPHKEDIVGITRSYTARLSKAGVHVLLNTPVSASEVLREKPDLLFVATGSRPVRPKFCADMQLALTADAVLSERVMPASEALVLGGGMIGCETAEFLASCGTKTTILEMRNELAADLLPMQRRKLLGRLNELGVKALTGSEILSVDPDGSALIKTRFGNQKRLPPFEMLVIAVGYRPNLDLCAELNRNDIYFLDIGDCRNGGKIMDAVHGAFHAVCEHLGNAWWSA